MSGDLLVNSTTIATVIGFKRNYVAQKIENTALDGTVYIQNTGNPIHKRQVHAYCATPEDRERLDDASNEGAEVMILWQDGTYIGFISGNITWKEWSDGHGVGAFTFLVDTEE